MPRPDPLRIYILRAVEAYEVGALPPITPIHSMSERYGVDSERYADPSDNPMISARMALLRHGIDVKWIVANYLESISQRRAERLYEWLQPGGSEANYSHWQRMELKCDRNQLEKLINKYKAVR